MEIYPSLLLAPGDTGKLVFRGITFSFECTEPVEVRISVDPVDLSMNFPNNKI